MAHVPWGWGFWWCIPLLFGVVWLLPFWLFTRRWGRRGRCGAWRGGPWGSDAVEVLRQRFARGEMDEDEYERRRRVLQAGRG